MHKQRKDAWSVVMAERGLKTGKGSNVRRGNQYVTADERKVEDCAVAHSSTYASEAATVIGVSERSVHEDVSLGNKLVDSIGDDMAAEVAASKLGTRDGIEAIGAVAKRDGVEAAHFSKVTEIICCRNVT